MGRIPAQSRRFEYNSQEPRSLATLYAKPPIPIVGFVWRLFKQIGKIALSRERLVLPLKPLENV